MRLDLSLKTLPSIKLAYRHFLNTELGAEAYERFKRVLYTDDDSLVQTLNYSILQHLPVIARDVLKVCDIGGGDGRRIRKILKFLHEKFGLRFILDFVEQSSYFIRSFNSDDINSFTEAHNFEMLFEDAKLAGGYDLVFLIHSIFAFESDLVVDKVLSLSNPGGVIVVVSNAQDSFLAGLKKILDVGYEDNRFEIADLLKILDDRRIEVRQMPFETKWAVSKDNLAQHTAALLEWLSLRRLADMGEDRKEQVREYIRCNSVDLGQRVLFTEREIIMVASP
jgi:SAM-dependent methyltransferase